jgi:hypothetical protein
MHASCQKLDTIPVGDPSGGKECVVPATIVPISELKFVIAGGSTNPEENGLLATVIRRVKDAGVPKENVEKALAKVRA